MVTPIREEKLNAFQDFEKWLDEKQLLGFDVLYRGQAESTWSLESTLYRHQLALAPHALHPSLNFPIRKYTSLAKELQAIVETHTDRHFDNTMPIRDPFPTITELFSFRYAVYLRHRGFPSPLLDWSFSPYVAAYFAFIDVANRPETKNGDRNDESRVAIYVMRSPTDPYTERVVGGDLLQGGIHYWPDAVKGETRHYDQQSAYTTAQRYIQYQEEKTGVHCYGSHEYILINFPQELEPGTNLVSLDRAIGDAICWKVTIPQHERASVLQRLDRMNINAYTLLRTEDALVETYGQRELRRTHNTIQSG